MQKNMRFLSSLILAGSILSTPLYANPLLSSTTDYNMVVESPSNIFVDFIDSAFSTPEQIHITDSLGNDVYTEYADTLSTYYSLNDYSSIQQLLQDNDISISYSEQTYSEQALSDEIQTYATRTETHSEYFYHLENDSNGYFPTKEWVTKITGNITVNPNTGTIISASTPTLNIEKMNFGSMFSTSVDGISVKSTVYDSYVRFTGQYRVNATLGVEFKVGSVTLPVGFPLSYGRHTDSFEAYPEF